MIKTKFVFAVSIVAIFAVNVANAKIAATSYVDEGVQTAQQTLQAAINTEKGRIDALDSTYATDKALTDGLALKEDRANKVTSFDDGSASDEKYPSTSAVKKYVSSATSAINTDIDTVKTALGGKQATISDLATIRSGAAAGATALQKADITTGTSNGTISVDGTNVAVKGLGTAAYTASTAYATSGQGTLADSAVQPGDLADVATSGSYNDLTDTPTIPSGALASKSTITNADVADNAAIAQSKISGLTTDLNAKLASVSSSGTGSVVKAVAKDGTAVKATLGYIGSSDITDGSITSADIKDASIATADIADGAVTTAKIAASAVTSAKIADGAVATADIAAGAVTAAKTSGVIGSIPSGSATSTTYATIWVE